MKYDPNWLQKAKAKKINADLKALSHIIGSDGHAICGKGFFNGISVIQFPSLVDLPGCRSCREKYLTSISVPFNENGRPFNTVISINTTEC